ncbi:hypothetical protein [Mycolicibacterium sp. 018/SC-01/001]|uniref:hypothetical protein n=1 Tax=Mycolicibacterium sp. 018/SC-01/001 TaxID=2592069 RepID=UPI002106DD5A|nr:hypothetical protein [Mycolicibacterium sp. 018/SC-01/001]
MDDAATDAVSDALDALYSARPQDFTARRTELAAAAKRAGDAATAKQIGASRKPTVAAWVVNLVALKGTARAQLTDLRSRLRDAHAAMDGEAIRRLTTEQRRLVDELTRAGFVAAGITDPSAALRDDVVSTLQAAVADPEVLDRLGRLTRAEQWSGFGDFGVATAVTATRKPSAPAEPAQPARRGPSPAVKAALARQADADAALPELQSDLAAARLRVEDARRRLADAEQALRVTEEDYAAGKEASRAAAAAVKAARSGR